MARLEFENIYKGRILDNIQKLIKQVIPGIPITYDEHKGQESFLITPISDTFLDFASNSHIREYVTQISFQIYSGSEFTRDKDLKRLTDIAELVKRTLFDNRDLELLEVTQWYNGNVSEIIYERDEEEREKNRVILTFECKSHEVIA